MSANAKLLIIAHAVTSVLACALGGVSLKRSFADGSGLSG
jgi:hypothetical protein